MSVTPEILKRLTDLKLTGKQLAGVLQIFMENMEKEINRKVKQAERTRRHRNMQRDGNVTVTDDVTLQQRDGNASCNVTVTSHPPNGFPHPSFTPSKITPKGVTKGSPFQLSEMPEDWKVFCLETRPDLNPSITFDKFSDYWKAKPGKDGRKLDWKATWRNWVRDQKSPQIAVFGKKPEPQKTGVGIL